MRFNNYLKEAYLISYRHKNRDVVIFKNPDKAEIREAGASYGNIVRFMLDIKHKDVYIWRSDFIHEDASELLRKHGVKNDYSFPYSGKDFIWGIGDRMGNKIKARRYGFTGWVDERPRRTLQENLKELQFTKECFGNSILDLIKYHMEE